MINLLIATGNNHKVSEIKKIMEPLDILNVIYLSGKEHSVSIDENGSDYRANAKLKIDGYRDYINSRSDLKSLLEIDYIAAEDSGLEVKCLKGEPGLFTARYAGAVATDQENIAKLLAEMKKNSDSRSDNRFAKFVCHACLYNVKSAEYTYFFGEFYGEIALKPSGIKGFGYDPVFLIPELKKTASELEPAEKNKISHRGIAFRKILQYLENE